MNNWKRPSNQLGLTLSTALQIIVTLTTHTERLSHRNAKCQLVNTFWLSLTALNPAGKYVLQSQRRDWLWLLGEITVFVVIKKIRALYMVLYILYLQPEKIRAPKKNLTQRDWNTYGKRRNWTPTTGRWVQIEYTNPHWNTWWTY